MSEENTIPTLDLEDFFKTEYISFSVYDNVRKIASYIDGQKNVTRKILYTMMQTNIDKFTKVSNLGPRIQDYSQYLHGTLEPSVVNMTQNYRGSGNNLPMLEGDGNFGSAFIPEAAATRYIFARKSPYLTDIFVKDDFTNLPAQNFEGSPIEPKYYVPVIPMLLVNGVEGLSIGFAQRIAPRDPHQVKLWVEQKAKGEKITADLTPHWIGTNYKVSQQTGFHNKWEIRGNFYRKNSRRIVIDCIPVNHTLASYLKVLDRLVEMKEIKDYEDLSDNDEFLFEIKVGKEFIEKDDDWIERKLGLVKSYTENYTCIDENNKIRQFESLDEILDSWYDVRISYNALRKKSVLKKLTDEKDHAARRASFVKGVVDGKIELKNTKEADVIQQAEAYDPQLEGYVPEFLKLPMRVLTAEEIKKQLDRVKKLEKEIKEYSKLTHEDILVNDLAKLQF